MISIIVPVYKAESYIHRCINSILAQSYTDFELLLIDDGSPDNCGAICDEYAVRDSRVRVFHKENGGVSSARNLGLKQARGEWITFIDADDFVHLDFLSSLYAHDDADLIVGSFETVGTEEKWCGFLDDCFYNRTLFEKKVIDLSLSINFYTPWAKLFRANIIEINNLSFDEEMSSAEDWLFVLNYLIYTQSLRTCSYPYYYYERGNVNGLSQNSIYFDEYFYSMEAFYTTTRMMIQHFGEGVKTIYLNSIAGACTRQCHYLYDSKESICDKLSKLRKMNRNMHLKNLFNDTTIFMRKKIKIFHLLMNKGLMFAALTYLYLLKGKIYS